ncbi:MAG TPA: dynamin family protein [Micromonospora sp.]
MMVPIWLDALDEIARTAVAHGRTDLLPWLRRKRAQLLDPALRVLVVGEPKQGKSQLVNALVNAAACPVGDGLTTAVPTVVRHADAPAAALVRTLRTAGPPAGELPATSDRIPMPVEQIPAGVGGRLAGRSGDDVHVEIGLPRTLLRSGLVLVDTPGTDEAESIGDDCPAAAIGLADTVLLVSESARELSAVELEVLRRIGQRHLNVVVVQTKIDAVPYWRAVADRKRQQLAGVGVPAPLVCVSAALRLHAAKTGDRTLNAESGFPELIGHLRRDLARKADDLPRQAVAVLTREVIGQLAAPLREELARQEAEAQSGPIRKLQAAQREVDELRRRTTRWQNTLTDQMADLAADVEYDLRDRTRRILRLVDEAFERADPLVGWETFEQWLERSLLDAAEANREWLAQRCEWSALRIAGTFARYAEDALPPWSVGDGDDLADRLPAVNQPGVDRFTLTQKLVAGMRGSYGGLLMFGLVMTLAGMPMINAVSVGAGVVFGGKSIRDESKSLLRRRQAAAKAAVQQYVDDFFIRVAKERRDTVRQVQRVLRDHFTARTEELQDAIVQSFRQAKQAADVATAVRDQRRGEIQRRMKELAVLYDQTQRLTGRQPAPARLETAV